MSESEEDNVPTIEDDVEIIENVEQNPETEEPSENPEEGATESEDKKEVKVKRVRNPQPKLDAERLKGPRGLQMLQSLFQDVQFKGRGHEEEDLSVLMKNYEYWCHRLFPKFPFDDCLERMEKLGAKRPMQTYLKRIRLDMLLNEDDTERQEEVAIANADAEDTEDLFANDAFDNLLPQQTQTPSVSVGLTDEQLERIRVNRERAQRVRQQMLIRNKATVSSQNDSMSVNAETSSLIAPSTSQDLGSLLTETNSEAMSVDSEVASQNSITGESFRVDVAADVHAPNSSEDCQGLQQNDGSGKLNVDTVDVIPHASQESVEVTHFREQEHEYKRTEGKEGEAMD